MYKICLTGGPCGGKSSSLEFIKEKLSEKGYNVIVVPEVATELMSAGITPQMGIKPFQRIIFEMQYFKEFLARKMAKYTKNSVILYDRGFMDQMPYTTEADFDAACEEKNTDRAEILNGYDCVIHLITAAIGTDLYSTQTNQYRRETAQEAVEIDTQSRRAWEGHKNFNVIDNSTDFSGKLERVMSVIYNSMGIVA